MFNTKYMHIRAARLGRRILQTTILSLLTLSITLVAIFSKKISYAQEIDTINYSVYAGAADILNTIDSESIMVKHNDTAVVGSQEEIESVEETEIINTTVYNLASTYINTDGSVTQYAGKKTYERYGKITKYSAGQLQQIASTDEYGFRKLDGRYLVAIGSNFNTSIGQYFDLVLENGTIIECIMGDQKADADTDSTNTFTVASGCASEFIVDIELIPAEVKQSGDISSFNELWDSKVVEIIVYDKYFEGFEEMA